MAEFVEVSKQWRRMCKAYSTDDDLCCEECRLVDIVEHGCGAIFEEEFADVVDWSELERRVMQWAAEHPEPVYPTWHDFLYEQGVLKDKMVCGRPDMIATDVATDKVNEPIPADIAQKLGIEPKER